MHQLAATIPLSPPAPALFSLRGLGYRYADGTPALSDINLEIIPGDRLALVGQNGAGKTTLAKHLNGLLTPSQGTLTYRGQSLTGRHLHEARLEIGLLFQNPDDQLFCNTVFEDVLFGPLNQQLDHTAASAVATSALQAVNLNQQATRAPHTLSYGQRKRAALATLLAMQPQVLILDEPAANLDPRQELALLEQLRNYRGSLICITHNLPFAYELCERAVVLENGRIHHDYRLSELAAHLPSQREHGLDFSFRCAATAPRAATDHPPAAGRPLPQIQLTDYSYRYPDGRQALDRLNLTIHQGNRIALVGENGAGKSTLAACLTGLRSGSGDFKLAGQTINGRNRSLLCRQIGLVFQDAADQLFCPSCREEVAFGPRQLGWSKAAIDRQVAETLRAVGLQGFEDRVPLHLSGGERKRLALAAVLAMQPRILILDEPTAGLDPQGEEQLLNILTDLDITLLLISHDLFFIRALTRRTLVLHEGRVAQDDTTERFLNDASLAGLNLSNQPSLTPFELKQQMLGPGSALTSPTGRSSFMVSCGLAPLHQPEPTGSEESKGPLFPPED